MTIVTDQSLIEKEKKIEEVLGGQIDWSDDPENNLNTIITERILRGELEPDALTVGTTWTILNNNTRIINAADGGWIEGRVQWRRTAGNTFEFRMQLALNRALSAGNLSIWFTVNGADNGANGQAGSLNVTNQNGTVWHQVGPIWSRTLAQVGTPIQAFGAQIRFQTDSFIFGGTQIGNGVWRTIRATANVSVPIVLVRGTLWLTRDGNPLRR